MTTLERGLGFREATAANMLTMIGIGPFVTIPLLISAMHGPQAMLGWILGAAVSICDGLVWAELGAAMPESGGPYRYLLEAYGPHGLGRLMSFLFLWQLMAQFPLTLASGAVGFSQYSLYLWPHLTETARKMIAMAVCLVACALIYRRIQSIGRWSIAIWCLVMFAGLWIVADGLAHARLAMIMDTPPGAFRLTRDFWIGLGGATLFATYDYGGYNTVCLLGGEIRKPARTIPRSILAAIGAVAALYLVMNFTILGVLPWQQAMRSTYVASEFMDRLHGPHAAAAITVLILVTAFASVFGGMLGFSRVPYVAAADGRFFRAFARLDPSGHFPSFSVLFVGIASAAGCLFDLESIVKTLIVIQTLIGSLAVVGAATMLRATRPDIPRPFRMWLYPLPSLIAFAGWTYIIVTSGTVYIAAGFAMLAVGIAAYLWRAKSANEWPWT
ncbi:MAG TPA: amino acid permease [Bryobacteraceae bacterium]|nr:amino acid permease [Bryobacteraceae bacterium]